MSSQKSYPDLAEDAKAGNLNAYNQLCTEFLEYVPWIIKDMGDLFSYAHIDMEDAHQEGCLAICEALKELMKSKKKLSEIEISSMISTAIVTRIYQLISRKALYETFEPNQVINYEESDSFKTYLNSIREESKYHLLRDEIMRAYRFSRNIKTAAVERKMLERLLPIEYENIGTIRITNQKDKYIADHVYYKLRYLFTHSPTMHSIFY